MQEAGFPFPVIYIDGDDAGDVNPDDLTHEAGGFNALVERARRIASTVDERPTAYSLKAIGSCLVGIEEAARLEVRIDIPLAPFGLCLLLLKGADIPSGKIFLGYVDGDEPAVLVAQTDPVAVYLVAVDRVAALQRIIPLDGVTDTFVGSLEPFLDAGLVGDLMPAINASWRPWEVSACPS